MGEMRISLATPFAELHVHVAKVFEYVRVDHYEATSRDDDAVDGRVQSTSM